MKNVTAPTIYGVRIPFTSYRIIQDSKVDVFADEFERFGLHTDATALRNRKFSDGHRFEMVPLGSFLWVIRLK